MHIYCYALGVKSDQKSGYMIYERPLMNFEHEILHVRYNTSKLGQTGRKIICKYIKYGWWHVPARNVRFEKNVYISVIRY